MDFDPTQPDFILLFMDEVSLFNVFGYSHICIFTFLIFYLSLMEYSVWWKSKEKIAPQGG